MHILYFHQHFSTPAGSTGTRSYEMARALVDRGHAVTMVCGSYDGGKTGLVAEPRRGVRVGEVDGINIIEICLSYSNHDSLLKRSITFLRFAAKSIGIAIKTPYDLLFATSTPLTAGIPGIAMRLFKPGQPFVFEVRDLWPELPREMGIITNPVILHAMSALEWITYRSADACIGLSPGIQKGIQRRCSSDKQIAMIPNGCDLQTFSPAQLDRHSNGNIKAVFTGAHGMANGLDAVLDAADVLRKRNRNDIQLFFIGDGKCKPDLMERAQRDSLTNCHFLDPIPKIELAQDIPTYDIGMMILANVPAFYYGTSPNKFFDYIASGLPILNNYPGWLADMITKHDCGIAVPPNDAEVFADALERIADDHARRQRQGKNARQLAEHQFDRQRLADQFADLLEVVENMRKPAS